MRQLTVLSGKGGTGKTTVSAALAHLLSQEGKIVLVDADVDAANLGLLLGPTLEETTPFYGGEVARVDAARCTACGRCAEVCRFDAVARRNGVYGVDHIACEGCAACYYQCPAEAIAMERVQAGEWYRAQTRFGPFVHARLAPGEENSGKLVSTVREQAVALAQEQGAEWVLVDGPPGTGCPVIAAVTGVDLALLVSEPTVSGLHDLERALDVTDHFGVPAVACINKSDINPQMASRIERFCHHRGVPVLARIPYDEGVIGAMRQGRAVTEKAPSAVTDALVDLHSGLRERSSV